MKMSEVFDLPTYSEMGGIMPWVKSKSGKVIVVSDHSEEISRAINMHDELVETLGQLLACRDVPYNFGEDTFDEIKELIDKASNA